MNVVLHRMAPVVLVTLALAGCDSGGGNEPVQPPDDTSDRAASRVVGDWVRALNDGDYERAAGFFARGAIVDQGRPIRLRNRAAARIFNATLPCRADLIDVEDEPGPRALASFRLRAGPGGPCEGSARVRVAIENGRFTEWRQLPQAPEPSGPVV